MKTILLTILFIIHYSFFISSSAQVGNPAPDFTITDVHGKKHHLYDYLNQGKKVVLDFFFTTCGPCQYYAPQVNKAYEKYGCNTQDVIFLSIDYNDTDVKVIDYENTYKTEYPTASGLNGSGNAAVNLYQIQAFPTVILIDSTKKIIDQMDPPTLVVFDYKFGLVGLTPKICLTTTKDPLNNESMRAYPNPTADGKIFVSLNNSSNSLAQFEVVDFAGKILKIVHSSFIGESEYSLDVSDIPQGTYLLKLNRSNFKPLYSEIIILK